MVLRRGTSEVPEIPRGFKGSERVLAAIVYVALKRAGYNALFLSSKIPPGLCIGLSGSTLVIGNINDPAAFRMNDAHRCAEKLNAELNKGWSVAGSKNLATVRQGRTEIGHVLYCEITVRRPNTLRLEALRRHFLK